MSLYWIGRSDQRDKDGWAEYERLVKLATEAHRDRYPYEPIVRGGAFRLLEGHEPYPYNRHAMLQFASMDAAVRFYESDEYQVASAVRKASSGPCELLLIEGLDLPIGRR